jgi:hypothetical protein
MSIIRASVIRDQFGELTAIYSDKWGYSCFCFSEGHSECTRGYIEEQAEVTGNDATEFLQRVQAYYNSNPLETHTKITHVSLEDLA